MRRWCKGAAGPFALAAWLIRDDVDANNRDIFMRQRLSVLARLPVSGHQRTTLAVAVTMLVLTLSCVTIEQRTIEVTPGVVPEELRGARWEKLPVSYCFVASEVGYVSFDRFVDLTNR